MPQCPLARETRNGLSQYFSQIDRFLGTLRNDYLIPGKIDKITAVTFNTRSDYKLELPVIIYRGRST